MKTLVDCDFVFDVLTRGPYPPLDSEHVDLQQRIDAQTIENHLASCHECRHLAEALVPSTELFHEALSDEERATLPAFNDTQMMARLHSKIIEAVFESDEDPDMVRRIDKACQRWLAPSMAVVPLIAACVLICLFADPASLSRSSGLVASLTGAPMGEPTSLTEMDLPENCLTPIVLSNSVGEDGNDGKGGNIIGNSVADATAKPSIAVSGSGERSYTKATETNCAKCHKVNRGDEAPIDRYHYQCCTSCHAAGNKTPRVGGMPRFAASCRNCHAVK